MSASSGAEIKIPFVPRESKNICAPRFTLRCCINLAIFSSISLCTLNRMYGFVSIPGTSESCSNPRNKICSFNQRHSFVIPATRKRTLTIWCMTRSPAMRLSPESLWLHISPICFGGCARYHVLSHHQSKKMRAKPLTLSRSWNSSRCLNRRPSSVICALPTPSNSAVPAEVSLERLLLTRQRYSYPRLLYGVHSPTR